MTHTFFQKNSNFNSAENFDVDQFIVNVSYAPDTTQLDLLFDTEMEGYEQMMDDLESGVLEHFIIKVTATYDGTEMGTAYRASNVAPNPFKYIEEDPDDIVDDMVSEVVDQARTEALAMVGRLTRDFLTD